MSLLIRTQKYIKHSLYIRRNISHYTIRGQEFSKLFEIKSPNFIPTSSNYSIRAAIAHLTSKVDYIIENIDASVQKFGRIPKNEFNHLLREFKKSENPSLSNSLLILRCCGHILPQQTKEEKLKFANEIWDTLKEKGIKLDIMHYNALLKVYLENDYQFSPNEILNTLENSGIKPDSITFDRLMNYHCKQGDLEAAKQILEMIKERDIPLNESIFNNLILGHSIIGKYDETNNLIKMMEENGLRPTSQTYLQLFTGYARNGDIDHIYNSIKELEKQLFVFSDKDLLELIVIMCEFKKSDQIENILKLINKGPEYNHEAKNVVYNLMNSGHYSEAFQVLLTMTQDINFSGSVSPFGIFFIRGLCDRQVDPNVIYDFCSKLESNGLNSDAYVEAALQFIYSSRKLEALNIFNLMKTKGKPIKTHNFWPFLSQIRSMNDAIDILHIMTSQFNLEPCAESIRKYIIPNIPKNDLPYLIRNFAEIGIDAQLTAYSLFTYWIKIGNFSEAKKLVSAYSSSYYSNQFLKTIGPSLQKNKNFSEFAELLVLLSNSNQNYQGQIITNTLLEVLLSINKQPDREKNNIELLKQCKRKGISLSGEGLLKVQIGLGNKMSDSIFQALNELTTQNIIKKQPLFDLYQLINNNDCDAANKFAKKKPHLTSSAYALLIDLNIKNNNLNETLEWFESMPNKSLDLKKLLNLIEFLLVKDKKEIALSLINDKINKESIQSDRYSKQIHIRNFLSKLPNYCGIEETQHIIEALLKSQIIEPGKNNLNGLITAYLEKDQIKNAVDQFTWCALQHRITPDKDAFLCKLIEISDTDSLQKIVDLISDTQGYINSAHDLVINLLRCNRFETAKKLLEETPALRSRLDKFVTLCALLGKQKDKETLEKLAEVSKGIDYIDPMIIYNELLIYFYKSNDKENAIKLYEQMKKENININNTFLVTLAEFLKTNNTEVPFEVPSNKQGISLNLKENDLEIHYKKAIFEENIKEALKERDLLKTISIENELLFIKLLLKNNEFNLIAEIIIDNIENNNNNYHIRQMLKMVSLSGHLEVFQICYPKISEKIKSKIFIDTFYLEALKKSGQLDSYLEKLKNNNLNSDPIPKMTIGFLSQNTELLSIVETIAKKMAEKDDCYLINVLWLYYFAEKNDLEASKLWHDYLSKNEFISFNYIITKAERQNDVGLMWKLVTQMQTHKNVDPTNIGYIYSRILSLLIKNKEVDDTLSTLNNVKKYPGINYIQKDCLITLKKFLNKENIPNELYIPDN